MILQNLVCLFNFQTVLQLCVYTSSAVAQVFFSNLSGLSRKIRNRMTSNEVDNQETLEDILISSQYALGLSPGFFCFYAQIGVLNALNDCNVLNPTHVSGSSAGALVGGFLAAGMTCDEMVAPVLAMDRSDMWDLGGFGGVLKGQLFQKILETNLPIQQIKDCKIPYGATAYDLLRCRTNCITDGSLATTIRASCTFPGLFQPVLINNWPHVDGGIFDQNGLMALPGVPDSELIVNILNGRSQLFKEPSRKFPHSQIISIVLENIPGVTPFSMQSAGPIAYMTARKATLHALKHAKIERLSALHRVITVDGSIIDPQLIRTINETTKVISKKRKADDDSESESTPITSTSTGSDKYPSEGSNVIAVTTGIETVEVKEVAEVNDNVTQPNIHSVVNNNEDEDDNNDIEDGELPSDGDNGGDVEEVEYNDNDNDEMENTTVDADEHVTDVEDCSISVAVISSDDVDTCDDSTLMAAVNNLEVYSKIIENNDKSPTKRQKC
eukprot:gene839-1632_t